MFNLLYNVSDVYKEPIQECYSIFYYNFICYFLVEGTVSAMGKSIVILDKNGGPDKFACANIAPDKDTIKYVNVKRTPKFIV